MDSPSPRVDRATAIVLQLGALAVVLVAAPYKAFDLDRFFVPKEVVLHVCALLAGGLCLARARELRLTRADELLVLFLGLGMVSALFATNWWLAERAVAISLSGAVCFWSARTVAQRGQERALVSAFALAGVVGAVTALMQAYGVESEYVSLNRAPGGTFGNRNFMAHLCVIAMPALSFTALRARTPRAYFSWCAGVATIGAALVLSRSRAAWLAIVVAVLVMAPLCVIALRRGNGVLRLRRLFLLPVAAAAGGAAALVLPNALDWRSDSPYLDTARSVVNYHEGSGQGRLVQYAGTLRMTLRHPLLGVGPGNWGVEYPHFAAAHDPSLAGGNMTANPWPSSDWMTFLSERGVVAALVLGLAMIALVADGLRGLRGALDVESRLRAATLLGTVAVLIVVGSFDAVLLLPVAALAGWGLLGALTGAARVRRMIALPPIRRSMAVLLLTVVTGLAAARGVAQLAAMQIVNATSRLQSLEAAARLDPGSYRIHTRLAAAYLSRGACARARAHAAAAQRLYPNASAPRRVLRECPE